MQKIQILNFLSALYMKSVSIPLPLRHLIILIKGPLILLEKQKTKKTFGINFQIFKEKFFVKPCRIFLNDDFPLWTVISLH